MIEITKGLKIKPLKLKPGKWYHINYFAKFTEKGLGNISELYINGKKRRTQTRRKKKDE